MNTDTDTLIGTLVADAEVPRAPPLPLRTAMLVAALASLAVAGAMAAAVYGVRPQFAETYFGAPALMKLLAVAVLAAGGFFVVLRQGAADRHGKNLLPLLPGVLLLLLGALLDGSGLSIIGRAPTSPLACVSAIVLVSLLPLAAVLLALRQGAPTALGWSGAAAGLFAGALGATGYTIACKVDSGLFVAVWYPLAIAIMTGLGAALGRRALAW